jgi:hypothetical protein
MTPRESIENETMEDSSSSPKIITSAITNNANDNTTSTGTSNEHHEQETNGSVVAIEPEPKASSSSTSSESQVQVQQQQQEQQEEPKQTITEGYVRPSIVIKLIRHAESRNNQVYRDARFIYRGGTSDFDLQGWTNYVEHNRTADPTISDLGQEQSQLLATNYLIPHLSNQSSFPIHFIISPMKRTIDTIRPTIHGLLDIQKQQQQQQQKQNNNNNNKQQSTIENPTTTPKTKICDITINGFYFESEGCHTKEKAEDGMSPKQIHEYLFPNSNTATTTTTDSLNAADDTNEKLYNIKFEGFPDIERGWYCNGTKPETRKESEIRANKFYNWFCDHLDTQLGEKIDNNENNNNSTTTDIFDASVCIPGEENENEHDKYSQRIRRRRTTILIGHGDFMNLLLQRIMTGYGHTIEKIGTSSRSAYVHWNTGITELEYFGHGRFLMMSLNSTPQFITPYDNTKYRSGGSLKDGWSYLVPDVVDADVTSIAISEDNYDIIPDHIRSQTDALRELYLPSSSSTTTSTTRRRTSIIKIDKNTDPRELLSVMEQEEEEESDNDNIIDDNTTNAGPNNNNHHKRHFIVKRGLQVVAVATYSDKTGKLYDVAIRPTGAGGGIEASTLLIKSVQEYVTTKLHRSGSLYVQSRSMESHTLLQESLL